MKLIPKTKDDLADRALIRELSGLEFMKRVLAGELPSAPISALIGYDLVSVEKGHVVFEGGPRFELYNPIGSVHGGWFGILLDSCMGCAVHTALPAGKTYTTLEYKVNILRAATEDSGVLQAEGRVIHAGRRTATAEGKMTDRNGKIFATGVTTCIVLDVP